MNSLRPLAASAAFCLVFSLLGCVGDEPGTTATPDASLDDATIPNNDGSTPGQQKANGVACGGGSECASGNCADGVCCDSACTGTCEKCNLPGTTGQCTAIPDGQDPDNECPTIPLPDAGPPTMPDAGNASDAADAAEGGAVDGGSTEAGSTEAGSADAGAVDAGEPINLPEGGVSFDDTKCAGKCNGKRACSYPSSTTTCGSTFCNTTVDEGRAACDGQGHCLLEIDACQAYSCPAGSTSCKTSCTGESDCLPTYYCDNGTCKPKLANGTACASVAQCQSGYCVTGNVCCNDPCNGYPGATCTQPNSVGTCRCSACASGPCKAWYKDGDGDGYGDPNAAIPGCVSGPAPQAGYVDNNTDCDDTNPNVHPGQTGFFATGYGPGNTYFDYNCDGTLTKETPEYVGGSCQFCTGRPILGGTCGSSSTCGANNERAELYCGPGVCSGGRFALLCCGGDSFAGFTNTVGCGSSAYKIACGSCTTSGSGVTGTTSQLTTQRCN